MKRRAYTTPSVAYARAALAIGPLTEQPARANNGVHYRFGRRMFSAYTVSRLIATGEAVRLGNQVVAA